MKVPRPVRSRASSTRLIGWPIQLVAGAEFPGKVRTISPPAPRVVKPRSRQTVANRLWRGAQTAQKGPDARRRPTAAREAYSLYVERAAVVVRAAGRRGAGAPPSEASLREVA